MKTKLIIILLLVNFLALYVNHFDNSFHFDDSHTIENNTYITNLKNSFRFFYEPSTFSTVPSNQSYRPLLSLSFAIDYSLGKSLNPFYFHLTNFVAFTLQLVLMYFLFFKLLKLLKSSEQLSKILALISVTIYAFHGAIPDTVNYISARSDIFSTLAVVGSLLLFINLTTRKYFIYLLPAILGMLSKEQAGVLPGIIFFYILIFEESLSGKSFKQAITPTMRALLLALPSFLICFLIFLIGTSLSKTWSPGGSSRWWYLATQPYVILDYFRMFFYPSGLSADTDWELISSLADIRFFLGISFIALSLFLIFRTFLHSQLKIVAFGFIWFFLALIPSSSIIPLAEVKNDHRLFFPFVGLSIAVVYFTYFISCFLLKKYNFKFHYQILTFLLGLFLTINVIIAIERNRVWDNEESLWLDVTKTSPKNGRGLMNYALTLMSKAEYLQAEKYFLKALELTPTYPTLHINLGILYQAINKDNLANKHFNTAFQLSPNDPVILHYYGSYLSAEGDCDRAIPILIKSIELSPARRESYLELIECYQILGKTIEEQKWLQRFNNL